MFSRPTLNFERCLTIGRSHAITGKFKTSLALYARSLDLSSRALSAKSAAATEADERLPKLQIDSNDLQGFHRYIGGIVSQYRALVELRNLIDQQKAATKDTYRPPLVERLEEYPVEEVDLTSLVNFPPKLQPVPVKPLFFDLAWNYIGYPGQTPPGANGGPTTPKTAAEEKKEPAKKGWFGFGR
jgi:signal recognition particle subunit SRP68